MEQRREEQYDPVGGILVSRVGMGRDGNLSSLISALYALTSRL